MKIGNDGMAAETWASAKRVEDLAIVTCLRQQARWMVAPNLYSLCFIREKKSKPGTSLKGMHKSEIPPISVGLVPVGTSAVTIW